MFHYLFICIVLFLASFTLGTAGFGFAVVSVPLLSLIVSPTFAVPLTWIYGYGINFFLLLRFKEHIDWQKLWPLIIGLLPGIPLGIYMLKHTDDGVIKKIMGGVLVSFVLWNLLIRSQRRYSLSRFWALLGGFASGVLSGTSAMAGPPVLMYITLNQWEENLTRATLQFFFFVSGTYVLLGLSVEKMLTIDVLRSTLFHLPVVILGGVMGYYVFRRISSRFFNRILLYLLLTTGLFLIFS